MVIKLIKFNLNSNLAGNCAEHKYHQINLRILLIIRSCERWNVCITNSQPHYNTNRSNVYSNIPFRSIRVVQYSGVMMVIYIYYVFQHISLMLHWQCSSFSQMDFHSFTTSTKVEHYCTTFWLHYLPFV